MTLFDDQPWRSRAACRGADLALFFTEVTDGARVFCDMCPVAGECLACAVADADVHGIWGGLTAKQRRRLRVGARADVA